MSLVERFGRLLIRIGKPRNPSLPEFNRRIAEHAESVRVRGRAEETAGLRDIVNQAWSAGQKFDLPDAVYGPAHWEGGERFGNKPYPYYFFLAGFVSTQRCKRILEIGTHFGGSTLAMLRGVGGNGGAHIVTADIFDLNKKLHETPGITKLTGDANSEAMIKDIALRFNHEPIDLLYADADHRFEPTVINIALVCLLLRPRFVIIDDIVLNPEMSTMWDLLSATYAAEAVNCVDVVPQIRGAKVGFGLIRLRQ